MKVVVLVIASPGAEYECMKTVWQHHWQESSRWFDDACMWFVHGRHADSFAGRSPCALHDKVYEEVEESFIPGILDKTLLSMKDALEEAGADVIVRTNLSSVYLWPKLADFLHKQVAAAGGTAAAWVAGYSPDRSHLSGCNLIMSRAAAEAVLNLQGSLRRDLIDDVAISALCRAQRIPVRWVCRLDLLGDIAVLENTEDLRQVFHVRIKGRDRMQDVRAMFDLVLRLRREPGLLDKGVISSALHR